MYSRTVVLTGNMLCDLLGGHTLKLMLSHMRSSRCDKGLMESSGMFMNSSAEIYPCVHGDTSGSQDAGFDTLPHII